MKHNVVAPSVGESITEVSILKWAKVDGQAVKVGDLLMEIESDKATVEVVAEFAGALTILKPASERVLIGAVLGQIDDAVKGKEIAGAPAAAPRPVQAAGPTAAPAGGAPLSPAVRKAVVENRLNPATISGSGRGGRLTKGDVLNHMAQPAAAPVAAAAPQSSAFSAPSYQDRPGDHRAPLSMLRQKIAERLVQAQHSAAILTTFNEVDLTEVMKLRTGAKDAFKAKHGVSLGFMSFFTRAACMALKAVPEVNALIDGRDIITRDYADIGVAVGTDRGLVVPVVRNAHEMNLPQIEKAIAELAAKARDGKLSIADMSGGTFTISNGGVYGSLLSTPILNPPQSGILGMHKIQERPIALNGKVEIRPMMYLALSYDHRIIDGKGAVTFLVTLKELLETPSKMNLEF